jgi:hypothetical protein
VGLRSTPDDFAKPLSAFLNPDSPILSQDSIQEIFIGQLEKREIFTEIIYCKRGAYLR